MQYPNYMDAALKGLSLGSALAKLPREGAENATQKAYAEIAKEQAKAVQAQIKEIQSGVNPYAGPGESNAITDPSQKTRLIERTLTESGMLYGPNGGQQNPSVPVGIYGRDSYLRPGLNGGGNNGNVTVGPVTPQNAPINNSQGSPPTPAPNVKNAPIGNGQQPQPNQQPEGFPIPHSNGQVGMIDPATGQPIPVAPIYQAALQGGNYPVAPIG
jgi:hypothetical protein